MQVKLELGSVILHESQGWCAASRNGHGCSFTLHSCDLWQRQSSSIDCCPQSGVAACCFHSEDVCCCQCTTGHKHNCHLAHSCPAVAELKSGKKLEAGLVVVGVGAKPNTDMFKGQLELLEDKPGGVKVGLHSFYSINEGRERTCLSV